MNIFILDEDPIIAAQSMCDKHVVKMVTESAQMLSTAHRILDDSQDQSLYKIAHAKHPCTLWTMESAANYDWHYRHYVAIADEYTYRYGKEHGAFSRETNIGQVLARIPTSIPRGDLTPFAIAMKNFPDCVVPNDAVSSYRNYYRVAKQSFAKWTHRSPPEWYK